MNELSELSFIETPLIDSIGFLQLLLRFTFNLGIVSIILRFFYYPKSKRRDYYFTFTLISISIFLMRLVLHWGFLLFLVLFVTGRSRCRYGR